MAVERVHLDEATISLEAKSFLEACSDGSLSRTDAISLTKDRESSIKSAGLERAAIAGHFNTVRYLLEVEPPIELTPYAARAAAHKGLELYRLLHTERPEILNWDFGPHGNALICAVSLKDIKLVQYILEQGGDPGWSSTYERASRWLHAFSPIEICAANNWREIAKLLLRYGASLDRSNALSLAVCSHDSEQARFWIDLGVDVNFVRRVDDAWWRHGSQGGPLHIAVEQGQAQMVQLLLSKGASPLVLGNSGKTAIAMAEDAGDSGILGILSTSIGDNR